MSVEPETAIEILGKHRRKRKPWVTADFLDLCDKRRELRTERFEPEESEKYREVTEQQRQDVHETGKGKLDRSPRTVSFLD